MTYIHIGYFHTMLPTFNNSNLSSTLQKDNESIKSKYSFREYSQLKSIWSIITESSNCFIGIIIPTDTRSSSSFTHSSKVFVESNTSWCLISTTFTTKSTSFLCTPSVQE